MLSFLDRMADTRVEKFLKLGKLVLGGSFKLLQLDNIRIIIGFELIQLHIKLCLYGFKTTLSIRRYNGCVFIKGKISSVSDTVSKSSE